MTARPTIRKNHDTGRWTATRHRYGFTPGMETNTRLASHRDAVDWVYRRGPGSCVVILERSDPYTDGLASVPFWTPLDYPP